MDVQVAAARRCTIHEFDQTKLIKKEKLTAILEAGRLSSSVQDKDVWIFWVVDHREDLELLATVGKRRGKDTKHVALAPVTIALTAPQFGWASERLRLHYDLGQAAMSMQLSAASMEIGSCVAIVDDARVAAEVLKLKPNMVCPYLLTLGYPSRSLGTIPAPRRRPTSDVARWLRTK